MPKIELSYSDLARIAEDFVPTPNTFSERLRDAAREAIRIPWTVVHCSEDSGELFRYAVNAEETRLMVQTNYGTTVFRLNNPEDCRESTGPDAQTIQTFFEGS